MPKKLTEIPVECPCFVQEVRGEGYLRLFDLGFFRDSRVLPLYECAGDGTRVYRVKDTLIALRDADGAPVPAINNPAHVFSMPCPHQVPINAAIRSRTKKPTLKAE